MKKIYAQIFTSAGGYRDLVKFVNENNISQEAIVAITQDDSSYTLFFYHM